jgi:type II secretory pathway component GspD/PulD (secretin)
MNRCAIALLTIIAIATPASAQVYNPPPYGSSNTGTLPARNGSRTSSTGNGVYLSDVIRAYAKHMGIAAVFIHPSVPNRRVRYLVTNLDDATAFDQLLETNDLSSADINGVLHVAPPDELAMRYGGPMQALQVRRGTPTSVLPLMRAATKSRVAFVADDVNHVLYAVGPQSEIDRVRALLNSNVGGKTEIVRLKNGVNAKSAADTLTAIVDDNGGAIHAIPEQNALALVGSPEFIARAKVQLANIDLPPSQVFYTASIIEITPRDEQVSRGINLGPIVAGRSAQGASSLTGGVVPIGQISVSLDALFSTGQAKVLKRLTVAAANGSTASSAFDNQVPIIVTDSLTGVPSVRTVNAGVGIEVTPTIGTDGVTTSIKTTYTEITGYANNGYPNLAERTSTNVVTTTRDQTVLISGLYSDESLVSRSSNPPFSYIPIVGSAFKHRSETNRHDEVVIVVTPTISDGTTTGPAFAFPSIPDAMRSGGIAPTSSTPSPAPHP